MRLIRSRKGQSTAEYAVLFAIVISAAIGIQQYVKTRLQGAATTAADAYVAAVNHKDGGLTWKRFEPNRLSTSQQGSDVVMNGSKSGVVTSQAGGQSGFNKLQD